MCLKKTFKLLLYNNLMKQDQIIMKLYEYFLCSVKIITVIYHFKFKLNKMLDTYARNKISHLIIL